MQFTVAYRSADGAMVTDVVEAANRTECMAQMKARGIVPVSVKESGACKGRNSAPTHGAPRSASVAKGRGNVQSHKMLSWVGVVVLLAIICGGVWWWQSSRVNVKPPESEI